MSWKWAPSMIIGGVFLRYVSDIVWGIVNNNLHTKVKILIRLTNTDKNVKLIMVFIYSRKLYL